MKIFLKTALWLSLLAPALLACSKDKDDNAAAAGGQLQGTVSFTLNGDGFSNQPFTEKVAVGEAPVAESSVFGTAALLAVGTYTRSNAGRHYWASWVAGNAPGTYPWASSFLAKENDCQVIVWKNGQQATYLHYLSDSPPASGTTVVTRFDAVGGRIEGTFAGTLYNTDTDAPVTLTNGKFSLVRGPDAP